MLKNHYLIAAIASMGGFIFGFNTSVVAPAHIHIVNQFQLNSFQWGVVVSSTIFGAGFGSVFCGYIVDKIGSHKTLKYLALFFILAVTLSVFSFGFYSLLFSRMLLGIGIGIVSFVVPLYITKISPIEIRGRLNLFNSTAITGSQAIALILGYLMHDLFVYSWRLMFLFSIVPALILFVGMKFIHEPPLSGKSNKNLSSNFDCNFFRLLTTKPINKVLFLGILLAVFQQISGINVVMYYGPIVFESVGLSKNFSLLSSFFMCSVNTVFTIFSQFLVDKIGRRYLWILGSLLSSLSLAIFGWSQFNGNTLLSLIGMTSYIASFSIGMGSVFWVIISELYPDAIRALSMGICTSFLWFTNALVAITYIPMVEALGNLCTTMVFSLICLCSALFSVFFVPETKNVRLEIIERNIMSNHKLRLLGKNEN